MLATVCGTHSFACSTLNVLFINIRNERFSLPLAQPECVYMLLRWFMLHTAAHTVYRCDIIQMAIYLRGIDLMFSNYCLLT